MRLIYSGLLCAVVVSALVMQASAAPKQLYGRTVVISWAEQRTDRIIETNVTRSYSMAKELVVYVSSAGRVFSRYSASTIGRRGTTNLGASDQGGGTADAKELGARVINFPGRTMSVVNKLQTGARQISASFNENFSECSGNVIYGRTGSAPIIQGMWNSSAKVQIISISIGAMSCSIKSGNAFAQ